MAFMILGILTIVIAIFACLQLATEFVLTAVCYFIFVVILILLLIGAGAFWVNVEPSYPSFVNNTFDRAYSSFEDYELHQPWRNLQSELQCCGLNGMSDFESVHTDIQIDCCRNKTVNICQPEDMILEGCIHAFLYRVYLDRYLIGIVAIVAGSLMLLMLISSVFMCFEEDDVDEGCVETPYCVDEGEQEYYEVVQTETGGVATTIPHNPNPKHPAFGGVDLT